MRVTSIVYDKNLTIATQRDGVELGTLCASASNKDEICLCAEILKQVAGSGTCKALPDCRFIGAAAREYLYACSLWQREIDCTSCQSFAEPWLMREA